MTHPAHSCQKCGAQIGFLGRLINCVITLHKCKPDRILVDREGVAYLPTREVKLKGRQKPRP